jgi:hypothetical protein
MYNWQMTKAVVFDYINSYLKAHGYSKKDSSWYKENPETITVFNIDKSRFGEVYYVSLCVLFRQISDEVRPKFYKCHGRIRAEHLGENTEEYLDFEKQMDPNIREQRIKNLLEKSLPMLNEMETVSGFKQLLISFNPRFFMLNIKARDFLGISA